MSDTHVGKVVDGRYRLDRLLGEGAAGAVYAATQLSVDRVVAVKLLHDANKARFAAEAKAIAKLNHTNVITLHDFGYDRDLDAHFMVTEYAEGTPLSERMKEAMSTDLILKIALEVASALHHAHANGVLHRDLKPENVILTRADGRVDVAKVLDFGLAHLVAAESPAPANKSSDELEAQSTTMMSAAMLAAGAARLATPSALEAAPEPEAPEPPTTVLAARSLDELEAAPEAVPRVDLGDDDDGEVVETAVLRSIDLSADSKFGQEDA